MGAGEVGVFLERWVHSAGWVRVTGAFRCHEVVGPGRRDAMVEVALRVDGAPRRAAPRRRRRPPPRLAPRKSCLPAAALA